MSPLVFNFVVLQARTPGKCHFRELGRRRFLGRVLKLRSCVMANQTVIVLGSVSELFGTSPSTPLDVSSATRCRTPRESPG